MTADLETRLKALCGTTISAVRVEEHVHGTTRSLISIWLEQADGGGTQARANPHGFGLALVDERPKPADLGRYGHVEVVESKLAALRPGRVEAVSVVHVAESDEPVGMLLEVDGAAPVFIYSYDDELLIGDQIEDELGRSVSTEVCRARSPRDDAEQGGRSGR